MTEVAVPLLKRLENDTLSTLKSIQSVERLTLRPSNKKVYRTGAWYFGDFDGTQRNGWGLFKWTNGGRYEGYYIKNKRDGEGTYTWKDGTVYQGTFKDDLRHGYGSLTWNNGEVYFGQFYNDMRHGQGVYTWPDGGKYEGSFKKNMKSGYGVFTMSNGNIFEGIYEKDIRYGPGILSYQDTSEQDIGIWKGNMIIKLCTIIPNAFLYAHFEDHFVNAENISNSNKINSSLLSCKCDGTFNQNASEYPSSFPCEDILKGIRSSEKPSGLLERLSEHLLHAASIGDVIAVQDILIQQLIDPNVSDRTGNYPVLGAAVNCHLDVLNCLLDYGADINQLTNEGLSALAASHLLLYTEESFLPNIAENNSKEHLFNTVEIEKRTGNIVNRNDRKAILQIYENLGQYGVVVKRKGQTKANNAKPILPKRRTIMSRSSHASSKGFLGKFEEQEEDENPVRYDEWKLNHYQQSIDHVHEVDTINRTFKDFMLKPYMDPDDDDEEVTELIVDNNNNTSTLVDVFLESGEPDDLANQSLDTSLASVWGYFDRNNLSMKEKGPTTVTSAAIRKHKMMLLNTERKPHLLQTIKLLLKRGADPNASDLPMAALFFAVKSADVDAVRTLLEQNADTTAKKRELRLTPLHIAVALPCLKSIQITKLLLRYGADPNARDTFGDGRTPLHIVCCREDDYKQAQKIARMLLNYEANPNLLCQGNSALSLAIASGNDTIVDTLLKYNADTSLPLTQGLGSALCVATTFQAERHRTPEKRLKLIEKLVESGADLLTPVRVSDKFPPCTVVDYAYHVFAQDRRIACTPYHALSSLEREVYNSRRHMLEVLGAFLRTAALTREEELVKDMMNNGVRESTQQLLQLEANPRRQAKKSKRQQQDGGRDEFCGLRYVIIRVGISDSNGLGFKKKLRYCYECGRSIGVRLSPCTRCKEVFYCSKNCKIKAWNIRHREECTRSIGQKTTLGARGDSPTPTTDALEKKDHRPKTTPAINKKMDTNKQTRKGRSNTFNYNRSFFPQI